MITYRRIVTRPAIVTRRAIVRTRDLGHEYGTREILRDLDLVVRDGEFVCIVGPSGIGKTTLLRCLAGLQTPTSGEVVVAGTRLTGPSSAIGLVFQDYSRSLLPWLTVAGNVALPLRRTLNRSERERRTTEALREVGLADSAEAYPWQLSGGMQQRVAIARAIAVRARVLLMDEPFASVDAQTREGLEDLVLRVREDQQQAVILITHDIDEAIYLADRIVVLGGKPARVRAQLDVPFGTQRDQLATKALPEFARLRAEVHALIGT
jgi:NitT/TauT family transport system ATP-binding protein